MQPTRTLAAVPQNYGFPMLSKWLTIPFALAALVFLFLAWEQDYQYAIYIVPSVVCLAVIYALSPQIDWWWYQKHPPELDPRLRKLLSDHLPFYQQLPAEGKQRFRQRVALFMIANEFIPKGMDSVPEDVKGFLAASAVQLTFGMENFLFDRFERIVVYPGPFPSPQYPRWHASELFEEDGVLLFSADHLMHAVRSPQKYFHLGMYEYGRALSLCYPDLQLPAPPPDIWEQLEKVAPFTRNQLEKWIGLPQIDPQGVSLALFALFPVRFREILPDRYRQFVLALGFDPVQGIE